MCEEFTWDRGTKRFVKQLSVWIVGIVLGTSLLLNAVKQYCRNDTVAVSGICEGFSCAQLIVDKLNYPKVAYDWMTVYAEAQEPVSVKTMSMQEQEVEILDIPEEAPVEVVNQYFQFYKDATMSESDIGRVIEIGEMREKAGVGSAWVSFEGVEGKTPNIYALTSQDGYIDEMQIDKQNQMYKGRYMIAVGPYIMNESYSAGYISAGEMQYGTYVDVVLRNKAGEEFYIPCVVADCKAHTYPNGFYQTGKMLQRDGTVEYVPECVDYSSIEFTAGRLNTDGSSRSAGLCEEYTLVRIILYTLEASLR